MTIGDGDIGSVLPYSDSLLFFASGVSDSSCTDEKEFKKERDLLMEVYSGFHVVYFSSLAVFTGNNRYIKHKLDMENMVKLNFPKYTIIRLGNIDFGTNPNTLINYLRAHREAEIRDEWRYICNKDELLYWVGLIPEWSCEMNIIGKRLKVKDIVKEYVDGK